MEQYERAGISANHMDMARFGTRNDSGYISVLKLLQSWMKDFYALATEKDESIGKGHQTFPKASSNRVINSTVSGGQVYFGDVHHCGSGNINFHAGS
jgi:tRNA(Glu) U13 pseudouridine synthase TruD